MKRVLALVQIVVLAACASSTAPTPQAAAASAATTVKPLKTWACAGQSNAVGLCNASWFNGVATVAGSWRDQEPITKWAADGELWPLLAAALQPHPTTLIWWQGEAEVLAPLYNLPRVSSYLAAFTDVVTRSRVGNPTLQIIIVEFGPGMFDGNPPEEAAYNFRRSDVWRDLQAFAASDAHTVIIHTEDLPFNADGTHAPDSTYAAIAQRVIAVAQ